MKTGKIKYSLKERGRQYRGQPRAFDAVAIAAAINSPKTQERVKNRDMVGYFGHWPRVKFGMQPSEGGLEKGKPFFVEPAIVTTWLRAWEDGSVEHEEEFLTTDSGQVAAKMFLSRVGGFSSAIDTVKPDFFGFDYVQEPNFTTNRGYALDDVRGMTQDDVDAAIYDEQIRAMARLLDSVSVERDRASEIIERLSGENEELLDLLAKKGISKSLDSAGFEMPQFYSMAHKNRLLEGAEAFNALSSLPKIEEDQKKEPEMPPIYQRLLRARK